ncbi:hypothetical protein BGZ60DRAFT_437373 [Tricladium varicosporioides]|nr:hypothetical protein BGZ60DRAFT_437373 [Hymenoscyphus varicosporioides]
MAATSILFQGGTVLIHDESDHIHPRKADVLIEGDRISKIEPNIKVGLAVQVVDCKNKIISPGFIDTHHHLWQTLLKGRHANELLLDYFHNGNFTSAMHKPEDIFWGELGGVLECLDAGTTTVVDHSHHNYSPEHSKAGIAAIVSSGIRSIYGYCPTPRVKTWKPFALEENMLEDWVLNTMEELATAAPFGDGRVQIGLAFDGFFLPKEMVVDLFERARKVGIKMITSHFTLNPIFYSQDPKVIGGMDIVQLLNSYNLLDDSILFSHATNITTEAATVLRSKNAKISTTPSTELQMALGNPVAYNTRYESSLNHQCSLGIDCHSSNSASIPAQMNLLLQSSRGRYNQSMIDNLKVPKKTNVTVEEVFNLGTVQGARAVQMEDQIGSLAVGKKADLVIFDGLSPAMVCAAVHDPVAAIVLHSSVRDIEMVIIDGIVRKENSMLKEVDLEAGKELWNAGKGRVSWGETAEKLVELREEFQERIKGLDMEEARNGVIKAFYLVEGNIVDN